MKLTLDTNAVLAEINNEPKYEASVDALLQLATDGKTELWLSDAYLDDQKYAQQHWKKNEEHLRKLPVIQGLPTAFKLGVSALGGHGDLATREEALADQIIQRILGIWGLVEDTAKPKGPKKYLNRQADAQHLVAHWKAGHDIFVTDDDHFLKGDRPERFKTYLALAVLNPDDALAEVRRHLAI